MKKYKWIVHPHSYAEAGSREVSVIHETEFHGMESYGWFNERKILIVGEGHYPFNDDVIAYSISLAQKMADDLNENNPVTDEEVKAILELKKKEDGRWAEINKKIFSEFDEHLGKLLMENFNEEI